MDENKDYLSGVSHFDYQRIYDKTSDEIKERNKQISQKERTLKTLEERESVKAYLSLLEDTYVSRYLETKTELARIEKENSKARSKLYAFKQALCKHPSILVTKEYIEDNEIYSFEGTCLVCQKRLNMIDETTHQVNVDMNALIYVKDRSDYYELNHEEITDIQYEFNRLRKEKNYTLKNLTKTLNNNKKQGR